MAGTHYGQTPISCLCCTLHLPTGSQLLSVYLGLGRRLKISAALGGAAGSHTQADPHPGAHAYPLSWLCPEGSLSFPKKNRFRTSSGLGPWPCWVSAVLGAGGTSHQRPAAATSEPSAAWGSLAPACCQPPPPGSLGPNSEPGFGGQGGASSVKSQACLAGSPPLQTRLTSQGGRKVRLMHVEPRKWGELWIGA